MHRPFPILVLCVTLFACRHAPAAEAPAPAASESVSDTSSSAVVREFRGGYTRGFEASWFTPCDVPRDDALWWVTLTSDALRQRDSLLKTISGPSTGALAVRWRGSTSQRMPAGHMGRGTRYILVTQVLAVRPLSAAGACFPASQAS
jgi:hypothetical protein